MSKRGPNHRLVKLNRSYSVEEIARLYSVHKNTIRGWVEAGLPVLNERRPMLILGRELASFLQARRSKNKRTCQPGEMYCFRCRAPKSAAGDMADYHPDTEKLGTLKALCHDCYCVMNRRVSLAKLEQVRGKLNVTFTQVLRQVSNSNQPNVNSDFKKEIKP
jgi:hypothetical protein